MALSGRKGECYHRKEHSGCDIFILLIRQQCINVTLDPFLGGTTSVVSQEPCFFFGGGEGCCSVGVRR